MFEDNKRIKVAYIGFIWHAFFLALTMSMLDLNTVFPALVSELTPSKALFGALYSIMLGLPLIFNLLFSYYLKSKKHKKKYLLIGIYLRAVAFLGMAVFTYFFGLSKPMLALSSFFLWIFIFSISGGLAGLSYSDITAKTIPASKRTNLYVIKQFFSSVAALLGGLAVKQIFSLNNIAYPVNYTISLFIGFVGLLIASIGFIIIYEPPMESISNDKETFMEYLKKVPQYIKADRIFKRYIIVENMSSFSVMLLPFYMIFAKEIFNIDNSYIGRYLLYQISGTIISTVLWGLLAKKFNSKNLVRICITIGGLIPLLAIGLSYLGPNYFGGVFLLIGFVISGRRVGFDPYLLEIAPDEHRTEYLGIRGSLNIFIVILPILGGIFIEAIGYYITFVFVSVVMLVASRLLKDSKRIAGR